MEALLPIAIWLLVFIICREIVCWYFKLTQIVSLLTEIRDALKKN